MFASVISCDFTKQDPFNTELVEIRMRIVASKTASASFDASFDESFTGAKRFILDEFVFSFAGAAKDAINQAEVAFTVDRDFQLPAGDSKRQIFVQGGMVNVTSTEYKTKFPILFRWEYWKQLLAADDEFINFGQPWNGKNHFWYHFQNADWTIGYEIEVLAKVISTGEEKKFYDTIEIDAKDYNSNPDWSEELIRLYDMGGTLIPFGYILSAADTKIVASFTKSSAIDLSLITAVIWIEPFEGGGVPARQRISSAFDAQPGKCLQSFDASNRVIIANPSGNVLTLTARIDHALLPPALKYTIYARIYEGTEGSGSGGASIAFEDGEFTGGNSHIVTGSMQAVQGITWTAAPDAGETATITAAGGIFPTYIGNGLFLVLPSGTAVAVGSEYVCKIKTIPATLTPGVHYDFVIDSAWSLGTANLKTIVMVGVPGNWTESAEFGNGGGSCTLIPTVAGSYVAIKVRSHTGGFFSACCMLIKSITIDGEEVLVTGVGGEEIKQDDLISVPAAERRTASPIALDDFGCPWVLNPLADEGSTDDLKNDRSEIYRGGDASVANITLELQQQDCVSGDWTKVADLNDNTLGTLFQNAVTLISGFGFHDDDYNRKYIGFLLEWKKVLAAYGEGTYRFMVNYTDIYGVTTNVEDQRIFCLKQFRDVLAEGTVRIESMIAGISGDIFIPSSFVDYPAEGWYQQVRLPGTLLFKDSSFTKEFMQYGDSDFNSFKPVINEQKANFLLYIQPIPGWMDFYLSTNVLQADLILLSDFNARNRHTWIKVPVMNDGNFAPKQVGKVNKLSSTTLSLAYGQNNLRKRLS